MTTKSQYKKILKRSRHIITTTNHTDSPKVTKWKHHKNKMAPTFAIFLTKSVEVQVKFNKTTTKHGLEGYFEKRNTLKNKGTCHYFEEHV